MNYIVYIIQSQKTGRFYIGSTSEIARRLFYHNNGKNKSTRSGMPWVLIHTEEYPTKDLALKREKKIKSYKSGNAFKNIIAQAGIV